MLPPIYQNDFYRNEFDNTKLRLNDTPTKVASGAATG
jgi:hypothetical protein